MSEEKPHVVVDIPGQGAEDLVQFAPAAVKHPGGFSVRVCTVKGAQVLLAPADARTLGKILVRMADEAEKQDAESGE